MKSITFSRVLISAAVSTLCIASAAPAALIPASQLAPYAGTGGAAYLYHLDSSGVNSGSAGATGNLTSVAGAYVSSSLNSNFNNALSGISPGGRTAAVALSSMTDAAGSFTVEAIVNTPGTPQNFHIASYSGENESNSSASVNGTWYLSYNNVSDTNNQGRLQFEVRNRNRNINPNSFSSQGIINALPNVTLTPGETYHIAATFNNTTFAFRLYVTQLTGAGANNQGQALLLTNGIGSGALGLAGRDYQIAVGQSPLGNSSIGTITSSIIDEVRISAGVLAPNQFTVLQAIPEPASLSVLGLIAAGLMGRKRARNGL